MAHSIEIRAGRLLEVSLGGTLDVEEVAELMDALDAAIGKATFVPVIVVSDWRWLPLMSHEASEQLLTRIKRANPRIARAAALASSDSPVTSLQFARLLQATNHASRRLFYDAHALLTGWSRSSWSPRSSGSMRLLGRGWEPPTWGTRHPTVAEGRRL
jgi:hypothetical protein